MIEISYAPYGDTSTFESLAEAEETIRACGYHVTLEERPDGIYNQDGEKVGESK